MSRRLRFLSALLSLVALLFSGAALAGYACPGGEKAAEIARMTEAGMPCAEEMARSMDDEQPVLCHAHCQSTDQSEGSYHPPSAADVLHAGPALTVAVVPAPRVPTGLRTSPQVRRDTGPPLAIRHCCFRI